MVHRIVLLGPPGAGKSTVTPPLVERFGLTLIATGKRLRVEMAAGSALGKSVESYLTHGELVPDELMERLIAAALAEVPTERGFLLDGYPRTLHQARALDGLLAAAQCPLTAVVALELSNGEVLHRLSGRRACAQADGTRWTLHLDDTEAVARCAALGGTLVKRPDDEPTIIAQRLEVYHEQTQPLLDHYQHHGLLHFVDAHSTPEEMQERVLELFNAKGNMQNAR